MQYLAVHKTVQSQIKSMKKEAKSFMYLYFAYAILAITVILLSIKAAQYVDLIDKKTNISGAFIGGVLLSGVTSLPELLTSLSATAWLDNPDLCLGNILGSNFFNVTVLAVLIFTYRHYYKKAPISRSHTHVLLFTIMICLLLTLNMVYPAMPKILTLDSISILILALYLIGVRIMAGDTETPAAPATREIKSTLTLRQIRSRFILVSLGLIVSSIAITYVTDALASKLNLGASFAGALFLGVATSLPEVTSCISLVKMKNFNVATGNITGSNLFNFFVLFLADLFYLKGSVYIYDSSQTIHLLLLGLSASILLWFVLKYKQNSYLTIGGSLGVLTLYCAFLLL